MRDQPASDAPGIRIRDRGWLPHVDVPSGTYFLTFRLADSLPAAVLEQWEHERRRLELEAAGDGRPMRPDVRHDLHMLFLRRIEKELDNGAGACWLGQPQLASLVQEALLHFDGERYALLAWAVMPNHVHAVARLRPGNGLADVVHAWKSFTARGANRLLGRRGRFWQADYYDHLVRNPDDLQRCVDYVRRNPSRAGLKNWPWVGGGP